MTSGDGVGRARRRTGRVARLRAWLLGGVIALLLLLAGLLGYARHRARVALADLPRRLGIDIKSETNDFTWTQSSKGRTLFKLHAAKAIQRENGKTTLHNVAITVYGPEGSHETDSIAGAQFEYDQPNGVVQAIGEVHMDLTLPAQTVPGKPATEPKHMQATTSGLVFLQKLGIAATEQPIHLVYGDLRGVATGAEYDSDSRMLRLKHDVHVDGMQNGRQVHATAAAAEIDRQHRTALLHTADVHADGVRASGDRVDVAMSPEGGVQQVYATGNAKLTDEHGMDAEAPEMLAKLTAESKLSGVDLSGGVQITNSSSVSSATTAKISFDKAGKPAQADLAGKVRIQQTGNDGGESTVSADRVVALLTADAAGHTVMREATATGTAQFRQVTAVSASTGKGASTTRITTVNASTLHTLTAQAGAVRYVSEVDGEGGTEIVQDDGAGAIRRSRGDHLLTRLHAPENTAQAGSTSNGRVVAIFAGGSPAGGGSASRGSATGSLESAVQTGHVVITQHTPAVTSPGHERPAQDSRGTGGKAEYTANTERLVLTGSPQVVSGGLQLAADRISLAQGSGDAEATGSVRGTFVQTAAAGQTVGPGQTNGSTESGSDTVHVIADRATVQGGGEAIFYGDVRPLRMWSATSRLDAPVVTLDHATGRMTANGGGGSGVTKSEARSEPVVHLTLLTSAGSFGTEEQPGSAKKGNAAGRQATSSVVRITGASLVYTPGDAQHGGHADVSGGVRIDSNGAQVTSDEAVATLLQKKASATRAVGAPALMDSGSIESITATGTVRLQQPGRSGTGERLVYTAADGRYVLTGMPGAPPRIADSLQGTVTGAALIFHGADGSVEVSGEPGQRVRTETHANRPTRTR